MREVDNFYLGLQEPNKSCLLALRGIILKSDENVSEAWKYAMPFFCYKGKMFCYFRVDRKTGLPYIGMVEGKRIVHPKLEKGERTRMKVMYFDPGKDLPIKAIKDILKQALDVYRKGIVKTPF